MNVIINLSSLDQINREKVDRLSSNCTQIVWGSGWCYQKILFRIQ